MNATPAALRGVTWVLALLAAVVVAGGVVVVSVAGDLGDRVSVGVTGCIAALITALALLVSRRRPANPIAPLLGAMAVIGPLLVLGDVYLRSHARRPDLLPHLPSGVAVALLVSWVWVYLAVALVMLFFPDGRLPGRRWRWVALGLPAVGVAVALVMVVSPGAYDAPYAAVHHPLGDLPAGPVLALKLVLFPLLVGLLLACAWSLRVRFRGGDAILRAQLKWLALAGLAVPATVLLSWGGQLVLGTHDLTEVGFAILYLAVPAAATVAILRHNLYDVDRALSLGVTYSVVTAGLLAVFALASFASGVVFGGDSAVVAAAVTAVTTLAIAPTRRGLQRGVDRRLYPMRVAAMDVIEDLRTAITEGRARPEHLQERLQRALRDPTLRVGILMPGGSDFVDAGGEPLGLEGMLTPVSANGRTIGAIVTRGPVAAGLRREIAEASAMLVEMVRLRLELSAALHEVEASRTRLQRVGDDERRSLERDLHDGAQQRLVSLGMSLRLAQRHLGDATLDVDGVLDEAVAQLGTAVAELREVAHGLRPSCLNEGLHPALSALVESATLPIDLDVQADGTIPDQVATTAYYVASESVANVVKHAEASRVVLRVAHEDHALCVRVEDDGQGGATVRPGSGLAGLSDRVAAAGGWLQVRSASGDGTTVEAVLPCAS